MASVFAWRRLAYGLERLCHVALVVESAFLRNVGHEHIGSLQELSGGVYAGVHNVSSGCHFECRLEFPLELAYGTSRH